MRKPRGEEDDSHLMDCMLFDTRKESGRRVEGRSLEGREEEEGGEGGDEI